MQKKLKWIFGSLILPILIGITATYIYASKLEHSLRNIDIVLLVPNGDTQGSQFALGLARAREWAGKLGQDRFGLRSVSITTMDELRSRSGQASLDSLVADIAAVRPSLVIGPLQSSSALQIVPRLVGIGVPSILGIPTRTSLTDSTQGLVWRMSPNDGQQADLLADVAFRSAKHPSDIVVYYDSGENSDYSRPLAETTGSSLHALTNILANVRMLSSANVRSECNRGLPQGDTLTLIYAGMPALGLQALRATPIDRDITWIVSDGCVERSFLEEVGRIQRERRGRTRVFVTFQAPPVGSEGGLKAYIHRLQMMGQGVGAAVSLDDCTAEAGAISYEVFGHDAYMVATELLRRADGSRNPRDVSRAMRDGQVVSGTSLLMGPYEFVDGENQRSRFHVYEIENGCPRHSEDMCAGKHPL